MSLDHKIDIQISLGAPSVTRKGFGTMLLLGDATFSERVNIYDSSSYSSATDLTPDIKDALGVAFAQPGVNQVAVGRQDGAESIEDALTAALLASSEWFGFTILSRDDGDIEDAADWAETNKRLFFAQSSDVDIADSAPTDIATLLQGKSYDMTAVLYYTEDDEYFDVGFLAGFLGNDFDSTAPTATYQSVKGIIPDTDDVGDQNLIEGKNGNYYSELMGVPATFGGTVASGRDIEHVVTGLWVEARLSEKIASLFLAATERGSRIPYSDVGITAFDQATMDVLLRGEDIGHFNEGTSETKMPLRADVAQGDLENGILRYEWGTQYSGVIKEAKIKGYVSLDFNGFGDQS